MKKHLLIASLALAFVMPFANADEVDPNDPAGPGLVPSYSPITLEWYYPLTTGDAANKDANIARTGIGVNGKFYVSIREKGVAVYGPEGQIKMIDKNDTWISINCDDAGHVYFRNDKGGWNDPLSCTNNVPMAWYDAQKSMFSVIDTKSDEIIASDIKLEGAPRGRFDNLPHVMGNMVTDFIEIPVIMQNGAGVGFLYDELKPSDRMDDFNTLTCIKEGKFEGTAKDISSQALAQLFNEGMSMAVLSNPTNDVTTAEKGWGNNIAVYNLNEKEVWMFSGKWLSLPNHNGCGGFDIFNYNGQDYILYPTGMLSGYPSADGFFITKLRLVDSPRNKTNAEDPTDWSNQLHEAVANKYATSGYGPEGTNYRGLNVEPIEGQEGKFRIYVFCPYKVMEVWILDLTGVSGVEDIVADKDEAKIFGGVGVVVTQSEGPAQVYTLAGQLVAQGKGTIAVPAGVYVVKADNKAAKIIVR